MKSPIVFGRGIIVGAVRLVLPADLDQAGWREIGTDLGRFERAVAWWVGDWWAFGEHRYGARRELTRQPGWQGPAYQSCANAAAVCRAFEFSRRRETLSFSHHEVVAALTRTEQDRFLDQAEREGWSRQQLRDAIHSPKRVARAVPSIDTFLARSIAAATTKAVDRTTIDGAREAAVSADMPRSDPLVSAAPSDPPPLINRDITKGSARRAASELAQFLDRFENSYGAIQGFVTVIERMREAQAMLSNIVSQQVGSIAPGGAGLIILTPDTAAIEDQAAKNRRLFNTRRRGTAEPRWGWSGVAPIIAAPLSKRDLDLGLLLPGHCSPVGRIVQTLRDLAGRYHRYLHQDDLGPTRAERMAALRLLLDQLDLVLSRLNGLPGDLRLKVCERLTCTAPPAPPHVDGFQAYRHDDAAVQELGAVTSDLERALHATPSDAQVMADLSIAAQTVAMSLCALDTTTAGAVAIDSEYPALDVATDADDLIGFAIMYAGIARLRYRAAMTLTGLERRRGRERCESLRWLVWQLCELYHSETGRRVTNSAVDVARRNHSGTKYTGSPQSPAGRFVLAVVKVLHTPEISVHAAGRHGDQRRTRSGNLGGQVYFAMREYIAHHRNPARCRR